MTEQEIEELLNKIAEVKAYLDVMRLEYDKKRLEIIPKEIQEQLADLESEFQGTKDVATGEIINLEAQVRNAVLEHGKTVKGKSIQAVYVSGKVSWDTKALTGYAVVHPEIEQLKKTGEPSVILRSV